MWNLQHRLSRIIKSKKRYSRLDDAITRKFDNKPLHKHHTKKQKHRSIKDNLYTILFIFFVIFTDAESREPHFFVVIPTYHNKEYCIQNIETLASRDLPKLDGYYYC